jgi:hypothetical protein
MSRTVAAVDAPTHPRVRCEQRTATLWSPPRGAPALLARWEGALRSLSQVCPPGRSMWWRLSEMNAALK